MAAQLHRSARPGVHAVRCRCAPTPPLMRINNDPTSPTSSTPATATWFARCRRSASNTAIPFISVQSWGTQTIEPIAQVIARPNETADRPLAERRCAKLHLRRQQSVPRRQVLRLGPRRRRRPRQLRRAIHRAVQPAAASSTPCSASPTNCSAKIRSQSATPPIPASTAASIPALSDYVARVSYQPNSTSPSRSRFRFDQDSFEVKRMELEGPRAVRSLECHAAVRRLRRAAGDRLPRPARRACSARRRSSSTPTGLLLGAVALRSRSRKVQRRTRIGIGYIDDCLILALNYITSYSYSGPACQTQPTDHAATEPAHAGRLVGQPERQRHHEPLDQRLDSRHGPLAGGIAMDKAMPRLCVNSAHSAAGFAAALARRRPARARRAPARKWWSWPTARRSPSSTSQQRTKLLAASTHKTADSAGGDPGADRRPPQDRQGQGLRHGGQRHRGRQRLRRPWRTRQHLTRAAVLAECSSAPASRRDA